jgi:two-component system sensor histidine kinase HydH
MKGDPEMLYRAFLNVFINAIQSMKKKGTVTVNISDKNDHYIVNIEDTGAGIKRENLKRIFNPFFSTKDRGSGLGLAIVRKIIEVHKGDIKIKSKKGAGTKVTITLPVE